MKNSTLLAVILGLGFAAGLHAQSMELNPDNARMARFDVWFEPQVDLDKGGTVEFLQTRVGSPVYAEKVGEWIWGIRAAYEYTSLDISGDPIKDSSLHRMELGPAFVYMPENSPWRGFMWGSVGLATDFSDVNGEDVIYSVLAAVGYKFSENFTLLAGGYYSQDFGDAQIIPGVGFIWKVSEEWTASLLPPRVRITYSPTSDWRLSVEGYPDGGAWSVEAANGEQASLQRQALRAGLRIERKIAADGWAYLGGGWAFGRDLRLEEEESGRVPFESDLEGGSYFSVGLSFGF